MMSPSTQNCSVHQIVRFARNHPAKLPFPVGMSAGGPMVADLRRNDRWLWKNADPVSLQIALLGALQRPDTRLILLDAADALSSLSHHHSVIRLTNHDNPLKMLQLLEHSAQEERSRFVTVIHVADRILLDVPGTDTLLRSMWGGKLGPLIITTEGFFPVPLAALPQARKIEHDSRGWRINDIPLLSWTAAGDSVEHYIKRSYLKLVRSAQPLGSSGFIHPPHVPHLGDEHAID